jgi:hypothetical protein
LSEKATATGDVKLILYFDESHGLTEDVADDSNEHVPGQADGQRTAYQTLCWAFNKLLSHPLFVIYLSTHSNLASVSPQKKLFWSSRFVDPDLELQPPFVELPFDISEGGIVTENMHTLDSVCEDKFMVLFGRPL